MCNLTLVDPSTPDRLDLVAGIELLCFAPHAEQLPHLRRPGDIIRLHRVKVTGHAWLELARPLVFFSVGGGVHCCACFDGPASSVGRVGGALQ